MARKKRTRTTKVVTKRQRIWRVVTIKKTVLQCEPIYVKFGEIIREARGAIGMTQAELAKKLKMSRPSIANIEVGRQRITLDDFVAITRALGKMPENVLISIR